MKKTIPLLALFTIASACTSTSDEQPPLGSLSVTTSAPSAETTFLTSDGWEVKYTRFLVNVSSVTVAGYDGVVTASATAQLLEQTTPGAKELVSSTNRTARGWEAVSFEIGPTSGESEPLEPVTTADRDGLIAGHTSVLVEGSMTRGAEVKTFRWGLTPRTQYSACIGLINNTYIPGLVVPTNGNDTAEIRMDGTVLFFDNLATRGHVLRGDPIAAADADKNGVILLTELESVPLETARKTNGLYGPLAGVDNLATFLNAQARFIVVGFRGGDCRITPIDEAP